MGRTIKFRAWDKAAEKMYPIGDWYYSSEYQTINMPVDFDDDEVRRWTLDDKDLELMQYTGLKDKNGTPIYEGDIVRSTWNGLVDVVEWDEKDGSWIFIPDTTDYGVKYSGTEVIGNIYESPELVTKDKE